jgi:hypothetical protein
MYNVIKPKEEPHMKVKRKFLRKAKTIASFELDANDVQIVVVSSLLEELEDGKPCLFVS